MAESPRALSLARVGDDPLVVWALASFHTATMTVLGLGALYLVGTVGDLLRGLETSIGLGLYLALWGLTWWATRNVLRELADRAEVGDPSTLAVVLVGMKWGGANGAAFFGVLLAGFAALNLPSELVRALGAVPFVLVAGVVGSVLALGIGGIIGALFASLDLAVFRVARVLCPDGSVPVDSDDSPSLGPDDSG